MSTRYRLYDWRVSDGPTSLGICQGDVGQCALVANAAQSRLLICKESGDEGWNGSFAEMAFTVSQTAPYLTTPREVARIEMVDVCDRPIQLNNQFAEYLRFGNGRMPKTRRCLRPWQTSAFTRNSVPTFVDITTPPQFIAVYATDITDIEAAKRVFIEGPDNNGNTVYTQDNGVRVAGQFLTLTSPFVISPMQFNAITGLQKDVTNGPVQFWQLDPTTGTQILLSTMEPGETVASYRRYFFDRLPFACCPSIVPGTTPVGPQNITVTAIAKLNPTPMVVDTDYFLLAGEGTLEAITEEAFARRYSRMDTVEAKSMAAQHHRTAVGFLNGILNHEIGKNSPAVSFRPFGSASLRRVRIGMT